MHWLIILINPKPIGSNCSASSSCFLSAAVSFFFFFLICDLSKSGFNKIDFAFENSSSVIIPSLYRLFSLINSSETTIFSPSCAAYVVPLKVIVANTIKKILAVIF